MKRSAEMSTVEVQCAEDACRLRDRMSRIRGQMDHEVEDLVSGAGELLDWNYYYRTFPWATLATAAAVGFLFSPRRRLHDTQQLDDESIQKLIERGGIRVEQPSKSRPSLLASAGALATKMAVRALIAYAGQQFGKRSGLAAEESEDGSRPWEQVND